MLTQNLKQGSWVCVWVVNWGVCDMLKVTDWVVWCGELEMWWVSLAGFLLPVGDNRKVSERDLVMKEQIRT